MRIWRKREKNLCVHGEYVKRIYAYMENMHKEFMLPWRMREKNLCVHGENPKRIYSLKRIHIIKKLIFKFLVIKNLKNCTDKN
jgi:hypothetical protein